MVRSGLYDAYDKWEVLCRHWEHPGSVAEPFADKWNRPSLPRWHDAASWGGSTACAEYIAVKLRSLGALPEDSSGNSDGAVNREIAQLADRLGPDGLQARVGKVTEKIKNAGLLALFDDQLSAQLLERLCTVFKAGALRALRWTDDRDEIPSIDVLRSVRGKFPTNAIKHKKNVLSLFCALYCGRNDVIHIHDIGPEHVTLVDLNTEALNDIQQIYPSDWTYVNIEFSEFLAQAAELHQSYDLIVSDPPRAMGVAAAWDQLPTIMRLCTGTFITNYFFEMFDELGVGRDDLDGLSRAVKARTGVDVVFTEIMERNKDVYWVVLRNG